MVIALVYYGEWHVHVDAPIGYLPWSYTAYPRYVYLAVVIRIGYIWDNLRTYSCLFAGIATWSEMIELETLVRSDG